MEVFTCWIGEQEKEIRNIKTKTTVQGNRQSKSHSYRRCRIGFQNVNRDDYA